MTNFRHLCLYKAWYSNTNFRYTVVISWLRLVGAKSSVAEISGVKVSAYSAQWTYIHAINKEV